MSHGYPPDERFLRKNVESSVRRRRRGRYPSFTIARVTRIDDPEGLRRIKVQYPFGQEEDEGEVIESDWIHQMTDFAGPTKAHRKRVFGWDKPVPEVGSLVGVLLNNGDPADAYYFGQPNYGNDGDTEAPGQFKGAFDKDIDWSWRWADPSGYEEGVDVEGNYYQHVPGNSHYKFDRSVTIEVGGVFKIICLYFGLIVIAVLRMVAAKLDVSHDLRPDEEAEATELMIETMRPGGPVREDPGIGKVDEFSE